MKLRRLLALTVGRNLLIAAVFASVGVVLLLTAPKEKPVQAQVGGQYSANWEATHLLIARLVQPDLLTKQKCETVNSVTRPYGEPANSEVAIGPSRWEVRGQMDDGSRFKEIWTTAQIPARITYGEGTWYTNWFFNGYCSTPGLKLKIMGNQNQEDWIIGFMQDRSLGMSAMEFRTIGVNDAMTNTSNYPDGNVRNISKTTSCQRTNRCVFTTGPYAWTTFHEIDQATESKYENVGTLIPAHWDVRGTLCPVGDNRCD